MLLYEDGGVVYQLPGGGQSVREGSRERVGRAREDSGPTTPTARSGRRDELNATPPGGGASRGQGWMARG